MWMMMYWYVCMYACHVLHARKTNVELVEASEHSTQRSLHGNPWVVMCDGS